MKRSVGSDTAIISQAVATRLGAEKPNRCRANMAHTRQSRPDSGLGFEVKALTFLLLLLLYYFQPRLE